MDFDPILSCPSDFSDSVTNHIETSTIVKLQQPHSNCITGQNTKLPLRVKKKRNNKKKAQNYMVKHLHMQREKQRVQSNKVYNANCLGHKLSFGYYISCVV